MTPFAFYGTFTSEQSGHRNLAGARFLERMKTAPRYRLYVVDGLPALVRSDDGVSVDCELYEVDEDHLARLAQIEPPGWARAPLELADGRGVEAFLASAELAARGADVSAHRGWPAYVAARAASERVRDVRERRSPGRFPISIGPDEGAALQDWVRREHALQTLETGLGFAISTLFICEALLANGADVRHVAADPDQFTETVTGPTAYRGAGVAALEEAGVSELVEFYEEESQIVLPRLLAEGRQLDLAFLDGNHRFEGVFLDLVYAGRLLRPGGIVFADDTQLPGVRRAVGFCVTNLDWAVEDEGREGNAHEWMVLRTGTHAAFDRPFDRFVEF